MARSKSSSQFLFAHAADDAAAGAVAAIGGAAVGDEKEDAVGIAMDQARHRHVRIFAARIGHVVGRFRSSPRCAGSPGGGSGNRDQRIDQVEEVGRDREGELVARKQHAAPLFIR